MVRRRRLFACLSSLAVFAGCSSSAPPNTGSSSGGAPSGGAAPAAGGVSAGGGVASTTGGAALATGGSSGAGDGGSSAGGALGGSPNGGASAGGASVAGGAAGTPGGVGAGGRAAGGSSGQASAGGSAGAGTGAPAVRIVGRTAAGTNGAVRFSWAGVTVNARFMGTQVSMNLNDGTNKNRFTVVVDGGTPTTVTSPSGQGSLALATGLTNGAHDLVVWRNTEASIGVTTFTGLSNFGTGGALLPPAAAPDRRIEVIGDSLSVGAGVEGTSTTCSPSIDAFTNNYLAYGSIAGRAVNADVSTIAWSGIGVYRSFGGTAPTMPARYDFAIPNDNTPWDFSKFQPQAVIINLGTNDFANGNPGQPYVDAYVSFIQHVRSKYATAPMILIDMYGGDRAVAINNVISALKTAGESQVTMLSFSGVPNNNTACNQHPNIAAQKAMGDLLTARLKSLLNW